VSFEVLLETLHYLQENASQLSAKFKKGALVRGVNEQMGEADVKNAPWLQDQEKKADAQADVMADYRAMINDLLDRVRKGQYASVVPLTDRLIAFNRLLTNPSVPEEEKTETEAPDNISHYQAVNVEHLAKGEGASRLELRDIPAQASPATLDKDLGVITEAIAAARELVLKNQATRLT
jgi:hypothetical protein